MKLWEEAQKPGGVATVASWCVLSSATRARARTVWGSRARVRRLCNVARSMMPTVTFERHADEEYVTREATAVLYEVRVGPHPRVRAIAGPR